MIENERITFTIYYNNATFISTSIFLGGHTVKSEFDVISFFHQFSILTDLLPNWMASIKLYWCTNNNKKTSEKWRNGIKRKFGDKMVAVARTSHEQYRFYICCEHKLRAKAEYCNWVEKRNVLVFWGWMCRNKRISCEFANWCRKYSFTITKVPEIEHGVEALV